MAIRLQTRPSPAQPGQAVEVRLIIGHPMETGLRRGANGDRIPRNLINDLSVRYGDAVVFKASLGTGIAANPYLAFWVKARASAPVVVSWTDEQGQTETQSFELLVSP
jgi:thiosulfate oxidation carrier complex protein SoxZ